MTPEEIWNKSLAQIEEKVGNNIIDLWFRPIKLSQFKEQQATVEIPNRFFKDWIEDNYPDIIAESIGTILKYPVTVRYKIAEKMDPTVRKMDMRLETRRQKLASRGIYLNPKYTFENFVIGPSNQFAHASAKAVAEAPGKTYNPLFIYGGVGLGKTHLITAIGNAVIDKKPDISVIFVSAEQFTNEVVSAIRHQKMGELKEKFRNIDLLLLDDIHFIENKTQTQEEFFHTFNTLYERQKQIVISSDRPPKEIAAITDRLRSRFSMGLIADIQPPELETKVAILQRKAETEKIFVPEDVAYYLASKVKSNIRELEGCLIRLGAQSSLTGRPINIDMAKNILQDLIEDDEKPITTDQIQKTVSEHFALKVSDMKAKKRTKEVALPRQIAMYLSKQLTNLSLSDIGKNFGGKDHATVIYACKQIEEKRAKDEAFNRMIESLIRKVKG
ncbi:MAG TPA: chromosomal replication initiator protein DnaA [Thermodesulfovibrionales bacterium]|jgi:chromosomal replication initiator protein|nr:chromosomal replication initiator protein DnaA [Thermodesulfovibrionales bacterium]